MQKRDLAQAVKCLSQYLREKPSLSGLCVRMKLWRDIVDKAGDGTNETLHMVLPLDVPRITLIFKPYF